MSREEKRSNETPKNNLPRPTGVQKGWSLPSPAVAFLTAFDHWLPRQGHPACRELEAKQGLHFSMLQGFQPRGFQQTILSFRGKPDR